MALITSIEYFKYYKNIPLSHAGVFWFLMYLFALIFPFLFAYATGEFWTSLLIGYEQPYIFLSDRYAMQCSNGSNFYTSSNLFTDYVDNGGSNKITDDVDFSFEHQDWNMDGKAEEIQFSISQWQPFTPKTCTALLIFNVGFRETIRLQMQAPVLLTFNMDFTNQKISISGRLNFHQKNALTQTAFTRNIYNTTDYLFEDSLFDLPIATNESLTVTYTENHYRTDTTNAATIEGSLTVPIFQPISYQPKIMLSFKLIWIQYIFIAIPVFYVTDLILTWAIKNRIFFAHTIRDKNEIS